MTQTKKDRILVITDDAGEGSRAKAALERAGFPVEMIGHDKVAIGEVDAHDPALIVVDTLTPRLADWPILPQLSSRAGSPPIVVLSSAYMSAQTLGVLNEMAADHLAKPIAADRLVGRCARLLKRRP